MRGSHLKAAHPLKVQEVNYPPELFEQILTFASLDLTVFLRGESGTGKTTVAKIIHQNSSRNSGQYLGINCATLQESLIEAELFGYVKGAFTGATTDRKGLFEEAKGGTIFLDEIGELTPNLQAKLLKVLETKTVRRVGGVHDINCDFRLIVATHQDLSVFREDFRYRIDQAVINLPPLRSRPREEIVDLWKSTLATQNNVCGTSLDHESEVIDVLLRYPWKGNYREFGNAVLKIVLECKPSKQNVITVQIVERVLRNFFGNSPSANALSPAGSSEKSENTVSAGRSAAATAAEHLSSSTEFTNRQSHFSARLPRFWEENKSWREYQNELFLECYDYLTTEQNLTHEKACKVLKVDRTWTYERLQKAGRPIARIRVAGK